MAKSWRTEIRRSLWKKQKGLCALCKSKMEKGTTGPKSASLDHIIPKANGGSDSDDNLRLAHALCNGLRGNDSDAQFIERLSRRQAKIETRLAQIASAGQHALSIYHAVNTP